MTVAYGSKRMSFGHHPRPAGLPSPLSCCSNGPLGSSPALAPASLGAWQNKNGFRAANFSNQFKRHWVHPKGGPVTGGWRHKNKSKGMTRPMEKRQSLHNFSKVFLKARFAVIATMSHEHRDAEGLASKFPLGTRQRAEGMSYYDSQRGRAAWITPKGTNSKFRRKTSEETICLQTVKTKSITL